MAGQNEDVAVNADDLYGYATDVYTATGHFQSAGMPALAVMAQLGTGQFNILTSVTTFLGKQNEAMRSSQGSLMAAIAGLGFLGQGTDMLGANYEATDGSAASGVDRTMVEKLFSPPPPGQKLPAGVEQEQPSAEDRQRMEEMLAAMQGVRGGDIGRVFNTADGSITVTVPAAPALTRPALPGEEEPAAGETKQPTSSTHTFTTPAEHELQPEGACPDILTVTDGMGGSSSYCVGQVPYDEDARRRFETPAS